MGLLVCRVERIDFSHHWWHHRYIVLTVVSVYTALLPVSFILFCFWLYFTPLPEVSFQKNKCHYIVNTSGFFGEKNYKTLKNEINKQKLIKRWGVCFSRRSQKTAFKLLVLLHTYITNFYIYMLLIHVYYVILKRIISNITNTGKVNSCIPEVICFTSSHFSHLFSKLSS